MSEKEIELIADKARFIVSGYAFILINMKTALNVIISRNAMDYVLLD